MAETEVTDLGHRDLIILLVLAILSFGFLGLGLYEDVGDLDVRVDHTSLVDVPESVQDVLGPHLELLLFDRLVVDVDFLLQVRRTEARVLHEQAESLWGLSVVVALHNVGVVHLQMDGALPLGELEGQF